MSSFAPAVYLGEMGHCSSNCWLVGLSILLALSFHGHWKVHQEHSVDDAVVARSFVNIVAKFTDEQYTTINQSTAGRFDPRVFITSCKLRNVVRGGYLYG